MTAMTAVLERQNWSTDAHDGRWTCWNVRLETADGRLIPVVSDATEPEARERAGVFAALFGARVRETEVDKFLRDPF